METYSSVECDVICDGFNLLLERIEMREGEEEEKEDEK